MDSIILNTDSYKQSHYLQYPPGTEYVYSYIESRGGEFDQFVFFGLQALLKKYLSTPVTMEDIAIALSAIVKRPRVQVQSQRLGAHRSRAPRLPAAADRSDSQKGQLSSRVSRSSLSSTPILCAHGSRASLRRR
jgi:hypothetical protein